MIAMEQQPPHEGKFLIVSSSTRLPDLPSRCMEGLPALKLAEAVGRYQRRKQDLRRAFDLMKSLPSKAKHDLKQ